MKIFENLANLKASKLTAGQLTTTKGFYQAGDGGGATYLIKTSADYGGTPDEYGDHTLSGSTIAVLQTEGSVNVKQFGATGDGVTDDSGAIQAALSHCRTTNQTLYFPKGDYYMTSPTTVGASVTIRGESTRDTRIKPNFSTFAYVFEFNTTNVVSCTLSHFGIEGPTQYDTLNGGIKADPSYVMRFDNLRLKNLTNALYLVDSWTATLSNLRITYCVDPVFLSVANNASLRDMYVQRFKGTGVKLDDALAPKISNLTMEYGIDSATGLNLRASQSAIVENIYTEGDMGTDISLGVKNSRRCVNTRIDGCWFNSLGTNIVNAQYASGLEIDNVVLQTPPASSMIVNADPAYPIYVGNVVQVDQNANGFVGDRRDIGQSLIPIANENQAIIMVKTSPSHGDYTDADLTNISNATALDSSNYYPYNLKDVLFGGVASDLDGAYTGYFNNRLMADIQVYAPEPTLVDLLYGFNATETVGNCSYAIIVTNQTNGFSRTANTADQGTTGGVDIVHQTNYITLDQGWNTVRFEMYRRTNDGGTSTFVGNFIQLGKYS